MSGNRTYMREGRTKMFTFREHGSSLQIKKKLHPWKSWAVGNSVKDPVNSFSTVKSKPAGICFVEVGNKDTRGLTVLHLLCPAAL